MQGPDFDTAKSRKTLPLVLLDARDAHGGAKIILEDPERTPLSYDRLILGAMVLGRKLADAAGGRPRVGVLLPSVNGAMVTFFGLLFHGLTPVMLNFTAGLRNLTSACETAEVDLIVTSRRFVDQARLDEVVAGLAKGRQILFLEDVRKDIGIKDKVLGLIRSKFARMIAKKACANPDAPAVVLFTSGTEGVPKGVVLSHANLVGNAMQIWQHADGMLTPEDVAFNPLPVFHSFGLTAGTLLGVLNGMKVVLYPSPLHYKQVPKLIHDTQATMLLATDTFLVGYARAADAGELASLKKVVTGAERVKEATRALWAPFGTMILEGYGCTECSPVLACNLPKDNRFGTVGTLLPGVVARLDPVEGIQDGAKLVVRGVNVMLGYMMANAPGKVQPLEDGWYDTGDIVHIDTDGFVAIRGRAKRFAKLGGEMVSLAAVEALVSGLWPDATHVALTMPDSKKGEQIVLVTDKPDADRAALITHVRAQSAPELYIPRAILVTETIPVLGSGKIDYAGTSELAYRMRTLI